MRLLLTVILTLCLLPLAAGALEYHVDRSQNNQVAFLSRTTFEDFEVRTGKMDGYVFWEGRAFPPDHTQLNTSKVYIEVQLNTLDAGNSMYNRHMKEEYLETQKYPYAYYDASVTNVERNSDSTFTVYTSGEFSIHGVARTVEIVGTARPAGEGWNIKCDFVVKMSDHDIELPKMMFISADEIIDVSLDFYIKPAH